MPKTGTLPAMGQVMEKPAVKSATQDDLFDLQAVHEEIARVRAAAAQGETVRLHLAEEDCRRKRIAR